VDSLDDLVAGFAAAQARHLPPAPVPTYAFTTSALDDTLAPPGHHTMYLACPSAPFDLVGGWDGSAEAFAERMIDTVCARVPGFRDTIQGMAIRTPARMASELAWPGAHPMVLDITVDQLAWMRPTRALGGHDTPVRGLFITGAGTSPVAGIAGSPGRAAAKRVLALHGTPRR
jgi:phytoene dehydrogenase-like protein